MDFVKFLQSKLIASATHDSTSGWMPGFFEEVIGGWVGEPLERPEQGESEIREILF